MQVLSVINMTAKRDMIYLSRKLTKKTIESNTRIKHIFKLGNKGEK